MTNAFYESNGLYLNGSCDGGSGGGTTTYKPCDQNTNPCTGFFWRDNTGQVYCRITPVYANCATDPNATSSFVTSPLCEDGHGVMAYTQDLEPKCAIFACNEPYAPLTYNPTACNACAAGYYNKGKPWATTLDCAKCPELDGVAGKTDVTIAAVAITQCYIPSWETTLSDETGQYRFDTDCYYKN